MQWKIEQHEAGMDIGHYLQHRRGFSRRILIAAKKEDRGILLNGKEATVRKIVMEGDVLKVQLPPEEVSPWLIPQSIPIDIVYEDDHILIVNKERGMATMTSPKHKSNTLSNAILGHYKKIGNANTVHVVTRLDRDTSGLVLIAKDRLTHSLLAKSQQALKIKRKYVALVHGCLQRNQETIHAPIARKPDSIIEREVREDGKDAITHYTVLNRWKDYTLVKIELETGRTHQIRVHFSHINHPLVGDDLYGGMNSLGMGQALHCSTISYQDVYSKVERVVSVNMPQDMEKLVEKLAQNTSQTF